MSASDDLVPLLVPDRKPQVDSGQGVLAAWNPDTFENVVEYRGATLTNLTVSAGADAMGWAPGEVVSIQSQGGKLKITSRDITPGTDAAVRAISFMRGQLAKQIARDVLAEGMVSASIPLSEGSVSNPGATYVAADGPSLSDIEISESGTCLVLLTSRINCQINQPTGVSASGWMSFRITGATTREPSDEESLHNDIFGPAADVIASTIGATRLVLVEGLNPGLHTFAARYRSEGVDPVPQHAVNFTSRNLTVVAL